jgi:hypothetical protein
MKIRQFYHNFNIKYKRILKRNQSTLKTALNSFNINKIQRDIITNLYTIINK